MQNCRAERLYMPDSGVFLWKEAFSGAESIQLFVQLLETIAWKQYRMKMFGKECDLPRLTAWYGEPDAIYSYSNIRNEPLPFTPVLQQLKERVETITRSNYNSVLLNLYRNGRDSMGWHADNERELGENPVIASVSFGAERIFQFRHQFRPDLPLIKISLPAGSLLLMQGSTQHYWKHQLPKTSKPVVQRINLTFRQILT